MRQRKLKEMREKKWFSFALLATAIFLFSQGSAIVKSNIEIALPLILISFILHTKSVGEIIEKFFKINYSIIANFVMIIALSVVTIICYFKELSPIVALILDLFSIAIYAITALISSKLNLGEK